MFLKMYLENNMKCYQNCIFLIYLIMCMTSHYIMKVRIICSHLKMKMWLVKRKLYKYLIVIVWPLLKKKKL